MQPASLDLALERGDDARVAFRFLDAAADPVVLEPGEITIELAWPGGALVLEDGGGLTIDGAAGEVVWEVTPDQLADAPLGRITALRLVRTTVEDGRRSYAVGLLTLTDGPAPGDQVVVLTVQALEVTVTVTAGGHGAVEIGDVPGLQALLDAEAAARGAGDAALDGRLDTAEAKLAGIEPGATANATNAQLRDRTTHTGVQAISTVTGLQTALDAKAPLASPTFTGTPNIAAATGSSLNLGSGTLSAGEVAVIGSGSSTACYTRNTATTGYGSFIIQNSTKGYFQVFASGSAHAYVSAPTGAAGFLSDAASAVVFLAYNAVPLNFYTDNTKRLSIEGSGHVLAGADNSQTLGGASNRWSTIYAGTGTINTSDAGEKAPAAPDLLDGETGLVTPLGLRVAARVPFRAFQWLSAIALKGEAGARIHFGWCAQDWQTAFVAEGLDPARYALWCRDAVVETYLEDVQREVEVTEGDGAPYLETRIVQETRTRQKLDPMTGEQVWRLGLRPDQCLAFLLAAMSTRLAALEA